MSFDSPFSDPAWVAIELYARVVDPLQLILEFPELPYVPFGQQQPRKGMPLRDVGDFRVKRQLLSIVQKQVVVASYEASGKHIDDFLKVHYQEADSQGFDYHVR